MNPEEMTKRFAALRDAFAQRNAAVLQCIEEASGNAVALLCIVKRLPNGIAEFTPVAKMLEEPLGQLISPEPIRDPWWRLESN